MNRRTNSLSSVKVSVCERQTQELRRLFSSPKFQELRRYPKFGRLDSFCATKKCSTSLLSSFETPYLPFPVHSPQWMNGTGQFLVSPQALATRWRRHTSKPGLTSPRRKMTYWTSSIRSMPTGVITRAFSSCFSLLIPHRVPNRHPGNSSWRSLRWIRDTNRKKKTSRKLWT